MAFDPARLLILLLALPLIVFDATFLTPAIGLPAAVITVLALALSYRDFQTAETPGADLRSLAICLLFATVLCILAGQGRFFYAVDDWSERDAILRDLVVNAWPPSYRIDDEPVLLRAPLGMYLTPALVGKLAGLSAARTALVIQNILSVALILYVLVRTQARMIDRLVLLPLFLLFSGLDIVPWAVGWGGQFKKVWEFPLHLEVWAGPIQYSSHVTQLFWATPHALAGLAFAAFYLRWRQGAIKAPALAMVFGICVLWSPLAAIGALPFLLFAGVVELTRGQLCLTSLSSPALLSIAVIPASLYLIMDSGGVAKQVLLFEPGFLTTYVAFLLIEVVPFYLILRTSPVDPNWARRAEFVLIFVLLILFPIYAVGSSNDFTMRASIPALAILAMLVIERVYAAFVKREPARIWMAAILVVGAATPAIEITRAFILPAERFSSCSLPEAWRNSPFAGRSMAAYIARISHPWQTWLLHDPGPMQSSSGTTCRDPHTGPTVF